MSNQQNVFAHSNQLPSGVAVQSIFDYSLDMLCSFDEKGQFLTVSAAAHDILGYYPYELTGRSFEDFILPDDLAKTITAVASLQQGEKLTLFENRYRHKSGKIITLSWSAQYKENGIIHAVARDITQLDEEKQKADAYKQRLSRAYHLAQIAWWEWNEATNELIASDELYAIYGLDKEAGQLLTAEKYLSMVHPEDLERVLSEFNQNRVRNSNSYDHRMIKPSGEVIYVIHYTQTIRDDSGSLIQIHGTTKDITERKSAELALKKSKRTLNNILRSISDGFFTLDKEWRVTFWNSKAEELLQKSKKDIIGKNIWAEFKEAIPLKFYNEYHRAVAENTPVHFEEYFPPLSMWIEVSAYPFNEVLSVYFRDVTERKNQEEALRQSNQRYETITNTTFDAIWDYDLTTGSFYRSQGFKENYGIGTAENGNEVLFWKKNIHPDDLHRVLTTYQKVLSKEETEWFQEFRFKKKTGEFALVQDKGVAIFDSAGEPKRLIGALRDITETQYLQALANLEKEVFEKYTLSSHSVEKVVDFYLQQIEALHPGIYCAVLKLKGNQLYNLSSPTLPTQYTDAINGLEIGPNIGSCGTAAFTKQKVVVKDIATDPLWENHKTLALHFNLRSCWSNPILNSKGEVMATFAIYSNGSKQSFFREEKTIDRASHVLKIILENRQQEEALQESNQRYKLVTKATSDAIWDWNLETNSVVRAEGFEAFYGGKNENLRNDLDSWKDMLHPEDREQVVADIEAAVREGHINWKAEYRCRRVDGSYAEVSDKGFVIRNAEGNAIRMVGAMQDITQQKETERLIKLSAERFRLLFHQSPKPKMMFSAHNHQIVEANNAALALYGYTREEFLSLTVFDLKPLPEQQELKNLQQQNLDSFQSIVRHIKKTGEQFYIEITSHAIDLPNGRHYIVDGDDMSEKLELQQKLIEEKVRAQKRIGEAVLNAQERERGEIGRELHDNVNQILTSAKLYQEMALSGTGDPQLFIQQSINLMMMAINENRRLSKRLSATTLGNIKLNESVQELVELVQSTNKFKITIDTTAINEFEVEQEVHLAIYRILQEHLTNIQRYAGASNVLIFFDWIDDQLVLKISDDGKGFNMNAKRSGIGISNMTMRAESLGGTLIINSAPGIGCVLIVKIPYNKNN